MIINASHDLIPLQKIEFECPWEFFATVGMRREWLESWCYSNGLAHQYFGWSYRNLLSAWDRLDVGTDILSCDGTNMHNSCPNALQSCVSSFRLFCPYRWSITFRFEFSSPRARRLTSVQRLFGSRQLPCRCLAFRCSSCKLLSAVVSATRVTVSAAEAFPCHRQVFVAYQLFLCSLFFVWLR